MQNRLVTVTIVGFALLSSTAEADLRSWAKQYRPIRLDQSQRSQLQQNQPYQMARLIKTMGRGTIMANSDLGRALVHTVNICAARRDTGYLPVLRDLVATKGIRLDRRLRAALKQPINTYLSGIKGQLGDMKTHLTSLLSGANPRSRSFANLSRVKGGMMQKGTGAIRQIHYDWTDRRYIADEGRAAINNAQRGRHVLTRLGEAQSLSKLAGINISGFSKRGLARRMKRLNANEGETFRLMSVVFGADAASGLRTLATRMQTSGKAGQLATADVEYSMGQIPADAVKRNNYKPPVPLD